jgi:peptidyl-prolyl cis-trans isomerase A (cyclophilin A)
VAEGLGSLGTNGSKVFITEVPTPHLTNKHTIFGQCENVDVVNSLAGVAAGSGN